MVPEISRKYGIENLEIILEEYTKCKKKYAQHQRMGSEDRAN